MDFPVSVAPDMDALDVAAATVSSQSDDAAGTMLLLSVAICVDELVEAAVIVDTTCRHADDGLSLRMSSIVV